VIRQAIFRGKKLTVFADETRPLWQGARLTAWELMQDGIDVTILPDGAADTLVASGRIQAAIVGRTGLPQRRCSQQDWDLRRCARLPGPRRPHSISPRPRRRSTQRRRRVPGLSLSSARLLKCMAPTRTQRRVFNPAFDVTPRPSHPRRHHGKRHRLPGQCADHRAPFETEHIPDVTKASEGRPRAVVGAVSTAGSQRLHPAPQP